MKILFALLVILALFSGEIRCCPNPATCMACHCFVDLTRNVSHNANEDTCNSLVDVCHQYVHSKEVCDRNLRNAFSFIDDRLEKDKFCLDIDACSPGTMGEIGGLAATVLLDCDVCIITSQKVKEALVDGPNQTQVKAQVRDACRYLRNFEDQCKKTVDDNLDAGLEYLRTDFNPIRFCQSLKLCPPTSKLPLKNPLLSSAGLFNVPLLPQQGKQNSDIDECWWCQTFSYLLKHGVETHHTSSAEVQRTGNLVCQLWQTLHGYDDPMCRKFASQYAEDLVHMYSQSLGLNLDNMSPCILRGLCFYQETPKLDTNSIVSKTNAALQYGISHLSDLPTMNLLQ